MTLPLLNNGASVVFLVSGAEKAEIVKEIFEGENKYPAQAVKPTQGELIWMLDKDAATAKLSSSGLQTVQVECRPNESESCLRVSR